MPDHTPEISIIVPTYREEANLRPLVLRIGAVMTPLGRSYEILIVDDDSQDGSDRTIRELGDEYPVKLIARTGPRDLSLAVVDGLKLAAGRYFVVMDADLSHPPEQIPAMIELLDGQADFVIGSRYVPGGRTEDWGGKRRLNSYVATLLARPLTGRITDPMAGFFALTRETFDRGAGKLRPIGYKIGLELMCRCDCRRVREVPITFQNRVRGQSKLSLRQQALYLAHLDRLYREYRRGWGWIIRPVVWMMLATVETLRRARRLTTGK